MSYKQQIAMESKIFYVSLGRMIQMRRKQARLTQAELAKGINVLTMVISAYERGINSIPSYHLHMIARMFRMQAGDLIAEALAHIADTKQKLKDNENDCK